MIGSRVRSNKVRHFLLTSVTRGVCLRARLADIRRLWDSGWCRGGGVLVSNNCFYNKTQQHYFWNFILMTQCKLCTHAAAVAVNKERSPMGQCSIYKLQTPLTHQHSTLPPCVLSYRMECKSQQQSTPTIAQLPGASFQRYVVITSANERK